LRGGAAIGATVCAITVKERGLPVIGDYWRGLSYEAKAALALLAGVLVVSAGFFAATGVSGLASPASDAGTDGAFVETLTIKRVVTLTSSGERTVVRTVRVVPRNTEPSVLGKAVELLTVTMPGPENRVTVPGQARTIVETRGGTTRTSVVTNVRVVTNDRTITNVRTQQVTVPVTTIRTVTDTVPVTQTHTTTQVLTETVVPPAATVTVTVTCPPKGCG
jgi:hypothetical protein